MPWNAGVFTRTDGIYNGSTVWQTAKANGVLIVSNRHDTHDQDIANGINACLAKDGSNTATAVNTGTLSSTGAATLQTLTVKGTETIAKYSADAVGASLKLTKSRNATYGVNTAVTTNDVLGEIDFYGVDTAPASVLAASMSVTATFTPGATKVPSQFNWSTGDSSFGPFVNMTLGNYGDLTIGGQNTDSCTLSITNAISRNWSWRVCGATDSYGASGDFALVSNGVQGQILAISYALGNVKATSGKLLAIGGIGVGNSAAATTLGSLAKKMEVFDANGASIGFVPIYSSIT